MSTLCIKQPQTVLEVLNNLLIFYVRSKMSTPKNIFNAITTDNGQCVDETRKTWLRNVLVTNLCHIGCLESIDYTSFKDIVVIENISFSDEELKAGIDVCIKTFRKKGFTNAEEMIDYLDKTYKKPKLLTEDTGKMFEKAICLAYNIDYDGVYKYDLVKAQLLSKRLTKLTELFPMCCHSAKKGARYDFTGVDDNTKHLSAKTTKKGGGKIAPQVIGQCNPNKFCELLHIEYTNTLELKRYIQKNIHLILPVLVEHTFDCPNVYYVEAKDTIRYITIERPIDWSNFEYSWTCDWNTWENSSTLKIIINNKAISLLEVQFHTTRKNMAVRWCYDNFLTVFNSHVSIVSI
jgi:hypothetical protein